MDLGISGKGALVMAAGGGLGGAISAALAREGVNVVAADIDLEKAEATAAAIRAEGGRAEAMKWDLSELSAFPGLFAEAGEKAGGIDILVNNTGGPPPGPITDVEADQWRRQFEAMVLSVFELTQLALRGMRERGWGRVITSASSGVVTPIPALGVSNAMRLSLLGWSKTLAREVAKDGVTVNVLIPGRIATPRVAALDAAKAEREGRPVEEVSAESTASIPVGRYGQPEEYAAAATFLASTQASYITGTTLRVDGGLIPSI